MLKTITASYKTFFKNFPVILLYALPLLVLVGIENYFESLNSPNRGIRYFTMMTIYVLPLVSAATDVAVYQRLFGFSKINPFASLKTLFIYLFVQLGIGIIAVLPLYLINYLFKNLAGDNFTYFCAALLINMFIGVYFLARFNIILPLIVKQKTLSFKDFMSFTNCSYGQWLLAAFLIYGPYIVINYAVSCPTMNNILTSLYLLVFVCFNAVFVTSRQSSDSLTVKVSEPERMTPHFEFEKIKIKPVQRPEEKTEPKKPAPKKSEPEEKKDAPKKGPLKKPGVKKPAPKKSPALKPVMAKQKA